MGDATKPCPSCGQAVPEALAVCRFCRHDFRTGQPGLPPPPPVRSGGAGGMLTGIAWIVGIVLIFAIVAAIVIPGMLVGSKASNERNASASLKTISYAQSDFRSNDRDNDGEANYWVRDVYGLFALCPSPDGTLVAKPSVNEMIKLVEPSIAAADGGGAGVGPGCVAVADAVGVLSPKAWYCLLALESYESRGVTTKYGSEGKISAMGKSYHGSKYGFLTAPLTYTGGKMIFIVNEDVTIWRLPLWSAYKATYSAARLTWSGATLGPGAPFPESPAGSGWSKVD